MSCKNVCKLCPRLVLSQGITFNGTSLVVNLPAGAYSNNTKYCIVLTQAIPATTTINAPVVFTVGTGTVQYPLVGCSCRPVTACGVRTRTKYFVCVETTPTSATFRMLGKSCCTPDNNLLSVNGTAPVALAAEGGVTA